MGHQGNEMINASVFLAAAIAEIAGCYAFWAWLRLDKSPLWALAGLASLALFAYLLTLIEASHAGRAYAAYGGVYVVSAIGWLWLAEGVRPDRWDMLGGGVCLAGCAIILLGPRAG
jgi:small multidrug resistance family-3 protein